MVSGIHVYYGVMYALEPDTRAI